MNTWNYLKDKSLQFPKTPTFFAQAAILKVSNFYFDYGHLAGYPQLASWPTNTTI